MAIMIPNTPRMFSEASKEGDVFRALEKLPREYYVIHSLKTVRVMKNSIFTREADFIIFHPEKGFLVLECKNGAIRYQDGRWYYHKKNPMFYDESGHRRPGTQEPEFVDVPMDHDGPYNQASSCMYDIEKNMVESASYGLLNHCRRYYGVWFVGLTRATLREQNLPPEADLHLTLTQEDLEDPKPAIEKIFSLQCRKNGKMVEQNMSQMEIKDLLEKFLCPRFDLVPTVLESRQDQKLIFHRLLDEQKKILDFLVDQPIAVINGAAGTGKTWVALEKARRHAEEGQKVLFLCFNKLLKESLEKKCINYTDIDFYNIAGFACKICNTKDADYALLNKELQRIFMEDTFPYQHIIIDEGQDFGQKVIEENGIMQLLCDMVTADESKNGSFYVFYDKLQQIQGEALPKFIEDADCRLTLTRNCRNTENIAKSSLAPVSHREPKLFDLANPGAPAQIAFCDNEEEVIRNVDMVLEEFKEKQDSTTVILTCKTLETSCLRGEYSRGKYKGNWFFSTCRKFKGLEADNIILVDVDASTFNNRDAMMYYVGSSRARVELRIITTLDDEACVKLLTGRFEYPEDKKIKGPKNKLADKLNALRMKKI